MGRHSVHLPSLADKNDITQPICEFSHSVSKQTGNVQSLSVSRHLNMKYAVALLLIAIVTLAEVCFCLSV